MVSHKHKCIFVHIPKTAGTSIEMLINQTPFSGTTHELLKEHASSEYFEEYFKFTFVRNTFERVYSVFNYYAQGGNKQHPSSIKQWVLHLYRKVTQNDYYTDIEVSRKMPKKFSEFCIEFLLNKKPFYGKNALISQYQFLEVNSEIKADFIGSFENLRVDLELVKKKLSIVGDLPHYRKASHKKHYSQYYDEKTKEIVSNYYQDEISYFGFEFENH